MKNADPCLGVILATVMTKLIGTETSWVCFFFFLDSFSGFHCLLKAPLRSELTEKSNQASLAMLSAYELMILDKSMSL